MRIKKDIRRASTVMKTEREAMNDDEDVYAHMTGA